MKKIPEGLRRSELLLIEGGRTPKFEDKLRAIGSLGMCVWSFPVSEQEHEILGHISMLNNGFGIQMPYPNLPIEDQPNLFFECLAIHGAAKSDYEKRKEDG